MRLISVETSDGAGMQSTVHLELPGHTALVSYRVTVDGDVELTVAGADQDGRQVVMCMEPDVWSALVDEAVQALSDPALVSGSEVV